MNASFDLGQNPGGLPKRPSPSSGCDLDCKEKVFRSLADRTRLCILDAIRMGATSVKQIAAGTGLSQSNISTELEHLTDCGCVTRRRTAHSLFYTLNTPRWLQLEAVIDDFIAASLKAPEVSSYE
ncbi:MAG: winged helix-turn-helix transcriptional regulator [Verrucomicrobia bacterium]|nr:winged helix-turn-helix transcriptional regulator [Verrucomicrobiota bacterium]